MDGLLARAQARQRLVLAAERAATEAHDRIRALDDEVARLRALMDEMKQRFPDDLEYVVSLDTTLAVTEGIKEISTTLWEAILLVILVVFLFLQSWRATLIPLLAVPVSLIGTLAVFPLLGFSINTLSLFGLVLAIGLVVDDAIVVVEAVEHHIEQGLAPREATLKAMEEVSGPVIAIALILAAVFIPTAFIPGITGRLYQQFAVTIAVSVLLSAFNALTLSPALAAMVLRPKQPGRGLLGRFFGWFNRTFARATDRYVGVCGGLIKKSGRTMVLLVGGLIVGFLFGERGWKQVGPFYDTAGPIFRGALCLFILEMGLAAGERIGDLRKAGLFLVGFGTVMPLAFGAMGALLGTMTGLSVAGATILATMAASASYIAAPAAVRVGLPGADLGTALLASLGITFPFNLVVGIPLYAEFAKIIA